MLENSSKFSLKSRASTRRMLSIGTRSHQRISWPKRYFKPFLPLSFLISFLIPFFALFLIPFLILFPLSLLFPSYCFFSFVKKGASTVSYYYNSFSTALIAAFPDIGLDPSKFFKSPSMYPPPSFFFS